ncbi:MULTISPECIES: 50S ribosomal protein L6 [Atopobiaceae]|uniref:Large ribosomal subunit protein uL6 n=1 Tax=Parafannyhessea umbonata TaxID=604330 RepID=A0A1H9PME6_9ACTN|nr:MULTISPECIES: 50S ribosomal protein L6 [Atopobiaceae]SEH51704.1 LSU ribosomal protein L6P [Parafannyhessea umbonata]SER49260.1 LSU ribosomal protein L6P [Parafannyhessea umbonata]SJZ74072.1 large subunit ribosomal protein L6 [Olsenella sp. KH1P3]
MSRIGKKPVTVPAGVTVTIEGTTVTVKGGKGELTRTFSDLLTIAQEGEEILVTRNDDTTESNAQQGLTRTLINNMVVGVSEGYEKKLELTGVGYRVALKGKDLDLSLGYSHPVVYVAPEGISFDVPDNTHITVKGISKEQVGQVAAEIRSKRAPEPYKGKGIHYEGEHIRRKLGKAAK